MTCNCNSRSCGIARSVRFFLGAAFTLALGACAVPQFGSQTPAEPSAEPATPSSTSQPAAPRPAPKAAEPIPSLPLDPARSKKLTLNAIRYLQEGNAPSAESELVQAIGHDPNNRRARNLLDQIRTDPIEYLGTESFEYKVRSNESISILAKRFLGDPLKFYALARYNGMDNPSRLDVGQVIRIPGERPSTTKKPAPEPKPAAPEPATTAAPVEPTPPPAAASPEPMAAPEPEPAAPAEPATPVQPEPAVTAAEPAPAQPIETTVDTSGAEGLFDEGRYSEAIDLLESAGTANSDERVRDLLVLSYSARADELADEGRGDAARALVEKAMELEPAGTPTAMQLENQMVALADRAEAERLFQSARKDAASGELSKAYDELNQVLVYDPDHAAAKEELNVVRGQLTDQYHKEAMLLYRQQELDSAISLWDQVLAIDPNYELAIIYRARAVELKKRLEQL